MSVHVFFSFSTGLKKSLRAPAGTKAAIAEHVADVETALGLKRKADDDGTTHWDRWDSAYRAGFPEVDDKTLCETVKKHNAWVRRLYEDFELWFKKPVKKGDVITPNDAKQFWCGLQTLEVAPDRWTEEFYRDRMEHLYEVMRGRESEGVTFDTKPLTPKQAAAVILLFSFLDPGDQRLDVPNGHDYLAASDDGGYEWCEKCGPAHPDDSAKCRRRKCPVRARDELRGAR